MRLKVVLSGLLLVTVLGLGGPLAVAASNALTERFAVDRLGVTGRLAAAASGQSDPSSVIRFAERIERCRSAYGIDCFLLDAAGRVRLSSGAATFLADRAAVQVVSRALRGREVAPVRMWPWQAGPLALAMPVYGKDGVIGAVLTISPTDRVRAQVWRVWAILAGAASILLVLGLLLFGRLASWMSRPLRDLAEVTDDVSAGRPALPVTVAGPPEVRHLAESFNLMARRVHELVERQRAFVADASHQLRNPLAALIIRLDDLVLRVGADLQRDAEAAQYESRRLAGMLERMLELARSERSERPVREQSLAPIVVARVTAWEPVAHSRGIALRLDPFGDVHARCNSDVLGEALDAVLDNALKFAPESSVVELRSFVEPREVVVCIRDHGEGLGPDELARIGNRFWRSAAHQNISGFGLGLSIVRASLERTGGRLEAVSPPGGGLEVRLILPRQAPVSFPFGGDAAGPLPRHTAATPRTFLSRRIPDRLRPER